MAEAEAKRVTKSKWMAEAERVTEAKRTAKAKRTTEAGGKRAGAFRPVISNRDSDINMFAIHMFDKPVIQSAVNHLNSYIAVQVVFTQGMSFMYIHRFLPP